MLTMEIFELNFYFNYKLIAPSHDFSSKHTYVILVIAALFAASQIMIMIHFFILTNLAEMEENKILKDSPVEIMNLKS